MKILTLPNTPRAFFCTECNKDQIFRVSFVGFHMEGDSVQVTFSALCQHGHQRGIQQVPADEWNQWVETGKEFST